MNLIWLGISAFGGGIVSGLLGWFESGEAFVARKFGTTVLRALLAGATLAIGYFAISGSIAPHDLIVAFLAGAGVDAGLKRLGGSIK